MKDAKIYYIFYLKWKNEAVSHSLACTSLMNFIAFCLGIIKVLYIISNK